MLSSSFSKVTLPSGRDSGILGQASILIGYARADLSSPTQRGHLVRSRILCQDVPPPPAGLDTKFTPNTNLKTTREQYLQGPRRAGSSTLLRLPQDHGSDRRRVRTLRRVRQLSHDENGVTIDATGTIYAASDRPTVTC